MEYVVVDSFTNHYVAWRLELNFISESHNRIRLYSWIRRDLGSVQPSTP